MNDQAEEFHMARLCRAFLDDESGATAIEYAVIAMIMAIGIIGSLTTLKTNLGTMYSNVAASLSN